MEHILHLLHPALSSLPFFTWLTIALCECAAFRGEPRSVLFPHVSRLLLGVLLTFATYLSGFLAAERASQSFTVADSLIGAHQRTGLLLFLGALLCLLFGWLCRLANTARLRRGEPQTGRISPLEICYAASLIFVLAVGGLTNFRGGSLVFDHGAGVRVEGAAVSEVGR